MSCGWWGRNVVTTLIVDAERVERDDAGDLLVRRPHDVHLHVLGHHAEHELHKRAMRLELGRKTPVFTFEFPSARKKEDKNPRF